MTTIHFNNTEAAQDEAFLKSIQPGDIILFSAGGKERPLRLRDRFIMLGQALFKKEYRKGYNRANAGITHVAICAEVDRTGPVMIEVNQNGLERRRLRDCFWYKGWDFRFRPLHVFKPNDDSYRNNLVAESAEVHKAAINNQAPFRWKLFKAIKALPKTNKTRGSGFDNDNKKEFSADTQCTEFVMRCMKNAVKRSREDHPQLEALRQCYPDLPSNIPPSRLLSYLLDKVEEPNSPYSHHIHLDIEDPYMGLRQVIEDQITRLRQTPNDAGAHKKANTLETHYNTSLAFIDENYPNVNSLEKARLLLNGVIGTLAQKRSNANPFKKATSLASAEKYFQDAESYAKRLR